MADSLRADLRFPGPPSDDRDEAIAEFVRAVLAWRERVAHALVHDHAALPPDMTASAADLMQQILTPEDVAPAPLYSSPYRLHPFPATVTPTRSSLTDLMQWRAGFADFLADIWDVLGEPAYSRRECAAMAQFLRPDDAHERCSSCLARLPRTKRHESAHACPMFAYITANWPGFAEIQRQSPRPPPPDPAYRIVVGHPTPPYRHSPTTPPPPRPARRPPRRDTAVRFTGILDAGPARSRGTLIVGLMVGLLLCAFAIVAPATSPRLLVAALGIGCIIAGVLLDRAEPPRP